MKDKEIRGGVLRISALPMSCFITKFFTGKARFINKNLMLRSIRRNDGDIPMLGTYYDFVFTGDGLPIIKKGMWPLFVKEEPIEGKENCYRLVLDPCLNKNVK